MVFGWEPIQFWRSTPQMIRLLWDEYLILNGHKEDKIPAANIVYREGKAYKKVTAKDAEWANNIF